MPIDEIKQMKTINEVENYRKSVNEECDKRAEFISTCIKANELSEKPFGYIKESFESISPELFKTAEGKKLMNKYASTIKADKNLSALHSLCENIRKAGAESDIDFFVNNIADQAWGVDKQTVDESCKTLGRVLAEAYIYVATKGAVVLPEENTRLSDAVYYIAENKKSTKNIAEFSSAVKVIRESVEKNEGGQNVSESRSIDEIANSMVEEFNKKYSSQLTAGEIDALKELSENEDREKTFTKYKDACAAKLSEAKKKFETEGNEAATEKISSIMEQISQKSYSLETVGNDICGMIKLSNIFD